MVQRGVGGHWPKEKGRWTSELWPEESQYEEKGISEMRTKGEGGHNDQGTKSIGGPPKEIQGSGGWR